MIPKRVGKIAHTQCSVATDNRFRCISFIGKDLSDHSRTAAAMAKGKNIKICALITNSSIRLINLLLLSLSDCILLAHKVVFAFPTNQTA